MNPTSPITVPGLPVIALRNEKALFALVAAGVAGSAVVLLCSRLTEIVWLTVLLGGLLGSLGISVAGVLLMDQACARPPRPLKRAMSDGFSALLRIYGVALGLLALALAYGVALKLLFFICKLLVVGVALGTVLSPILVMLSGLLLLCCLIVMSVVCPAIWRGATVHEALRTFSQIVSGRFSELLLWQCLLSVLTVIAGAVMHGLFLAGQMFVSSIADDHVGADMLSNVLLPVMVLQGYVRGITADMLFSFLLSTIVPVALHIMGTNQIYLRLTSAPAAWVTWVLGKKPVTRSVPPANPGSITPAAEPARSPDFLASLLAESSSQVCPHCRAKIQPSDRFCGECGRKVVS